MLNNITILLIILLLDSNKLNKQEILTVNDYDVINLKTLQFEDS